METTKKKKSFKLPHLLFLMLGMLILMSLMTYIIPAGSYAVNPDGTLDSNNFNLLGYQTPVDPWTAMISILTGLQNSAYTIALLLVSGASIGVILGTKAIDHAVDFALFKLQDKGVSTVVPAVVFMIGLLGAFGGGDHLVALVPVGVMMARKLRVDPIMAVGLTSFAVFMGSSWSPTGLVIPWTMMDLPLYSGFSVRIVMMFVTISLTCFLVTRYAVKVNKDPSKSDMGETSWTADFDNVDAGTIKEVEPNPRMFLIVLLFFAQYFTIVMGLAVFGLPRGFMPAISITNSLICGFLAGWTIDEIGDAFARGCGSMAFICFIIGLASTISMVMTQGNILHTIVHYASLPLRNLGTGLAAVGISIVITFINIVIPSASAKAAILFPIVRPMTEALNVSAQVGVQAFQIGDQFTNAISPFLGMTVASCAVAGVPFDKYVKFALRVILPLWLISQIVLYVLGTIAWTGM